MRRVNAEQLIGQDVHDSNGEHVGRIVDIQLERGEEECTVDAYLVGKRAFIQRLATWTVPASIFEKIPTRESWKPYRIPWDEMDLTDPMRPKTTVTREELRKR